MAKQERDDKAKVRFVFLEIEGGSAALQETVRSFAATLARQPPARTALPAAANGAGPTQAKAPRMPAEVDITPAVPPPQGSLFIEEEQIETETPVAPSRPKAQRAIPRPQVVPLDLTSGPVTLEAYCAEKQPDSDYKRYLVIAAWLKDFRNIPSVTMNEIFTCYRHLKWPVPPDPAQPLRDLKRKHNLFDKVEGKGAYAINHLGENDVAKMGASA
ncbi:hypothetical protein [Anaeromyxobacter soli]|uniref:hypothetical protein n=1 Tax=Anaeromyxobacter soli TaxID=2922725 RepID=UPI001FAFD33A|nr:hypothetical protein [Anaeromyxobacter sp. SG29]